MAKELTIELDGADGINPAALLGALDNTIKLLTTLQGHFVSEGNIHWEIVGASMKSPLKIMLAPRDEHGRLPRASAKIAKAFAQGLRIISESPTVPPHFDDDSLEYAKNLVEVANREKTGLKVYAPGVTGAVTPSDEFLANIAAAMTKTRSLYEEGTIEGRLEVISVHKRISASVWEVGTDIKVECLFEVNRLALVKEYLGERVAVTGRIKYRHKKAISIQVESIKKLKGRSELPQPGTIGKLNITDGASSEDYVRTVRDGE